MKILDEKPDALLKRAARGDERAFLALYQKHQSALYRYALRMTGSPWAAEEVVQEVFVVFFCGFMPRAAEIPSSAGRIGSISIRCGAKPGHEALGKNAAGVVPG